MLDKSPSGASRKDEPANINFGAPPGSPLDGNAAPAASGGNSQRYSLAFLIALIVKPRADDPPQERP
jgi:hypothetical protein